MDQQDPGVIVLGDVSIDAAARRLVRAGQEQPVEPKAFDVLLLLAREPGRAFGRDEILDAVWGHRHVTPGVLNRVMSMLRQALGEDAHHPRLLHTLHGVGYRLDAPPPVVETPAAEPPRRRRADDATAPAQSPASAAQPAVTRRRRWIAALTGVALLLAAALGWWAWQTQPRKAALVVMPLRADPADATLAAGLSDELLHALSRIEPLRVIARESTALATAGDVPMARLVERLGASHLLEGSLRRQGEALRVHVRLVDARDGGTLWSQAFERDARQAPALQREIAAAVAAALAQRFDPGGAARGTGDAAFQQRYYAAMDQLDKSRIDDTANAQAEAMFRALLREQPVEARALAGLALALEARAHRNPPLADALREEAQVHADAAMRADPTLAIPHGVRAAAACRASRWQACLDGYATARRLAPSAAGPPYQYAMALAALGYLDQAEAVMREGLARDPLSTRWQFGLGRILDTRGQHDAARVHLARAEVEGRYARWFNAAWRGRPDEALQAARYRAHARREHV